MMSEHDRDIKIYYYLLEVLFEISFFVSVCLVYVSGL
jgi:hypothetical protein